MPEDGNTTSPIWAGERSAKDKPTTRPSAPASTYAPVERVSLLSLLSQPRYRPLLRRVVIAVVVGIVAGVLLKMWQAGVTAAVVAAIADTVVRARSHSTVPAWRRASVAERRTEAQLKSLERKGYRTLHARAIPDSDAQIDHLVIGPTGVYAVDSEKWDKRLPVRAQSHRKLFLGPFSQKARLDEARWEASRAAELIGELLGREVMIIPSLAIYGPSIPWKVLNVREVDVFDGGHVRKWITKRERSLTEEEIDKIYEIAEKVLPARYPESPAPEAPVRARRGAEQVSSDR
ncbi:nuclease-related domain-containing protein [Planobispora takensis]|uniref:nuclease-related domain-containing protein n=1 Tax=Planobispora takensis TaxID=1367882 RepID=UPI001EF38E92|nr:nuclease-related domain-containing protein [Planobispora takensis]